MEESTFLAEQLALVAGHRFNDVLHSRSALTREGAIYLDKARILTRSGDFASAAIAAERAVAESPQSPDARALLGALHLEIGDAAAAAPQLAVAAQLAPKWAEVSRLCGEAAYRAGDMQTARTHLQKALVLRPDWPEASVRLGETLLKLGEFADGFRLIDSRFAAAGLVAPGPRWDGNAPLWDKSVLIVAEREIGDLVQFIRYADLLKKRGATVYVTCPGDLVTLLETVPGVHRAVPFGVGITPTDYVIPLLGLPLAFGTTLATVPANVPYLTADEGLAMAWNAYFTDQRPESRLRVGLVWADAGDPSPIPVRSVALADLAPLWAVKGVDWFAMQQGPQRAELPFNETPLTDISADLTSPGQIVAAIAALDLLIAVDTPAAHVAGAMNTPAWAMLSAACDWRWLGTGETTPWYPSVRCFRQQVAGEWESVARRIAAALTDVLAGA